MARRQPVRLDQDKIVSAALRVADRQGVAGMTVRVVGSELGADPTAIYRHFASKDALVAAIADRLFGAMADVELPRPWRARLWALLQLGRDTYRAHPTVIDALAQHAEESQGLVKVNEALIGCLRDAGLDEADVGRFHQVLSSYVLGTALLEQAWAMPGVSREASRRWYGALDPDEQPNCVASAPHLFPPADEVFGLAVEIFLDAIASAARRRRAAVKRPAPTKKKRNTP
jgi:AcrR family transcriptional regulator